jgi:hypothetical protein
MVTNVTIFRGIAGKNGLVRSSIAMSVTNFYGQALEFLVGKSKLSRLSMGFTAFGKCSSSLYVKKSR